MNKRELNQLKASELIKVKSKFDPTNKFSLLNAYNEFKTHPFYSHKTGAIAELNKINSTFEKVNQFPSFYDNFKNNPCFNSQKGAIAELNKVSSIFEKINQLPKFFNQFQNDFSALNKLNLVFPKSKLEQNHFQKFKIDVINFKWNFKY